MDAICIGELLIDFTPEKEKYVYRQNPGGAPANVAVAMARAGAQVGFIGKVGKDAFGDYLVDILEGEHVKFLLNKRAEDAVTTMVFISHDENGERSFSFIRKPGADMLLNEADIDMSFLRQTVYLNASSISLSDEPARSATLYAMQAAACLGKIVCFDVNYRDMIWQGREEEAHECILNALEFVDLLKMSDEEVAFTCCGHSIKRLQEKYNIHAVVVTHGEKGAHCYIGDDHRYVSSIPEISIDSTGAGDAFWGNTLAFLIRKGVNSVKEIDISLMAEAMRWGNAAGAYCVQRMGGIPGMPMLDELQKRLE